MLGAALASLAGRLTRRSRFVAWAVTLAVLASGPVLVIAKDRGRLASGGWVRTDRARQMARVVDQLARDVEPAAGSAQILMFGALDYDLRVLGDPRGRGFGQQQVLASAVRVRYGRDDLEVLSLPAIDRSPVDVFGVVLALITERPGLTHVVATSRGVRDLTELARSVALRGGDAGQLRAVLLRDRGGR
jgi:hypothetical protein